MFLENRKKGKGTKHRLHISEGLVQWKLGKRKDEPKSSPGRHPGPDVRRLLGEPVAEVPRRGRHDLAQPERRQDQAGTYFSILFSWFHCFLFLCQLHFGIFRVRRRALSGTSSRTSPRPTWCSSASSSRQRLVRHLSPEHLTLPSLVSLEFLRAQQLFSFSVPYFLLE